MNNTHYDEYEMDEILSAGLEAAMAIASGDTEYTDETESVEASTEATTTSTSPLFFDSSTHKSNTADTSYFYYIYNIKNNF